jgi:FkbM family methyltransferase
VYCFNNKLSVAVAGEVLSGKPYPLSPLAGEVRTIVDIGANIGASAVYFSLNYPQATIFAFEPCAAPYELLVINARPWPAIRTFPFGLFNRNQSSRLYLGAADSVTGSLAAGPETSEQTEDIELRDARGCLAELGVGAIDILKIDTEGCERHVFASLGDAALAAKVIYVEFHSERDRLDLDRMLVRTHALFAGHIRGPHRGELCYVARRLYSAGAFDADAVDIPLE